MMRSTRGLSRRSISRGWMMVAALAFAAAILAGCGDDDETDTTTAKAPPGAEKRTVPSSPNAPGATEKPNGFATLRALEDAKKAQGGGAKPRIAGLEGASTEEILNIVGNDIGTFWQEGFNGADVEFQAATQYVVPQGAVDTACGEISQATGPDYCSGDNTIVLPVRWYDENVAPIGDFAIAWITAFVWGQQVQDQLGANLEGRQEVLVADCLAGVWSSSVYQRGLIEQGDLEEGAKLIAQLSESEKQFSALVEAFDVGYESGNPGACAELAG